LPLVAVLVGQVQKESLPAYRQRIEKFRADSEADLKSEEGWLRVAGLYWLEPGESKIGSGADNKVVLPARAGDPNWGTLTLADGHVTLNANPAAGLQVGGKPVTTLELKSDDTRVSAGNLKFMVISRGARTGLRVFDPQAKSLTSFTGEKWFPVDPKLRVRAKFVPYTPVRTMPITNVLGDVRQATCPGYVEFVVGARLCRLEAEAAGSGYFFNFKDKTSGDTTYGAGRFLNAPKAVDGYVDLDFNLATNPPCAFTAYATCPLPPQGNTLAVAIRAGELAHHPVE